MTPELAARIAAATQQSADAIDARVAASGRFDWSPTDYRDAERLRLSLLAECFTCNVPRGA